MKMLLWVYAVVGTLYSMMFLAEVETVVRYAVGPLWLMMMAAPCVLGLLVIFPIAWRVGLFDK